MEKFFILHKQFNSIHLREPMTFPQPTYPTYNELIIHPFLESFNNYTLHALLFAVRNGNILEKKAVLQRVRQREIVHA